MKIIPYKYNGLYEGYSEFNELRSRGGGGIVTTLLLYALEKGIINEALVVRKTPKEPYAEPLIARTPKEIISAAGSKYTFVPYGSLIKKLQNNGAVVGLPCQIRQYSNKPSELLKIGLFCGLNLSPRGLNYLLKNLRVNKEQIEELDYRAPGGGLLVKLKKGSKITYGPYFWLAYYFPYKKCLYCCDFFNHFSDIAVGDMHWGTSIVITYTERGKALFLNAVKDGIIKAKSITEQDVIDRKNPYYKKKLKDGNIIQKKFIEFKLVRVRGKWVEYLPLWLLKQIGNIIHSYLKRQ